MATNIVQDKLNHSEEKQQLHKEDEEEEQQQQHEDEEEEEALSLCDLPINLNDQPRNQEHLHHSNEEEFNFRSWGAGAPFPKEPEMCAADEVFFKGQILPLRLSFSSEAGLLATLSQSQKHYGNSNRSESLDCNSSDFKNSSNNSSRSSSLRSQNSSTSTSSTSTFKYAAIPKIQNQFHAHPSPKPQLRSSVPTHSQSRKSTSAWGIFRLGVVPAPEIGLQDLKVRNRNCGVVSRNSSNSSSSSNSTKSVITSNKNKNNHKGSNHNVLKQLVGKGGGLLSGCDCSFETVQPKNMVMIKGGGGGGSGNSGGAKSRNMTESTTHAAKEKVVGDLKNRQKKKQGKKVTSRRRTFEWIKELHATQPEDEQEALLSNA